jgi:hypothetical protein
VTWSWTRWVIASTRMPALTRPMTRVAGVVDGGDRADGRAEGAGVGLGEGVSLLGAGDVAEELLPDLARLGVRPADALRIHDRDEVDLGVPLDADGVRLQMRGGIGRTDRRHHRRRVRDRARHRHGLAAGRVLGLAAVADVGEQRVPGDDDRYQHGLHAEELAGQAAGAGDVREAHVVSVPLRLRMN